MGLAGSFRASLVVLRIPHITAPQALRSTFKCTMVPHHADVSWIKPARLAWCC